MLVLSVWAVIITITMPMTITITVAIAITMIAPMTITTTMAIPITTNNNNNDNNIARAVWVEGSQQPQQPQQVALCLDKCGSHTAGRTLQGLFPQTALAVEGFLLRF